MAALNVETGSVPSGDHALPLWLLKVREQADSLKFGSIQITIHEAQVTQIEVIQKLRLAPQRAS